MIVLEKCTVSIFRAEMETAYSSETLVMIYQITVIFRETYKSA
jgi:hypothetical protein